MDASVDVGRVAPLSYVADLVELCERDGDIDAVREWCRHALSLCDHDILLAYDDQEAIEETLDRYADSVPTPRNRRNEERFDHYWMLSVDGEDVNVVTTADGKDVHAASDEDEAPFAVSLLLNDHVSGPPFEIEVTVLQATGKNTHGDPVLSGPDEMFVDVRLKRYEAGEWASTHDVDPDASVICDPAPDDEPPARVRLAYGPGR